MKIVDPNTAKRIGSRRPLRALMGASLLFGACSSGQVIIQQSSIPPGLYVGDRECNIRVNGEEQVDVDSQIVTIDNNGLAVVNGETIHVGLVDAVDGGSIMERSVIEAIAVSANGFTIDWDVTLVRDDGGSLGGYMLESYKALGPNTMEVRSTIFVSTEGLTIRGECVAVLSR